MIMGKFVNSLPEIFLWSPIAPKEGGGLANYQGGRGGCSPPRPHLELRVEGWRDGDGLSEALLSGLRERGGGPQWFSEGSKSHVIFTWTWGFCFLLKH